MTDIVEGIVSKLRGSIEVKGGYGENAGTSTTHITTFQLGDRAVRFRSTTLPAINDGDVLIVAGNRLNNGQLDVLAFRNKTTGVTGDATSGENWAFAIAVSVIGIGAVFYGLLNRSYQQFNVIALVLGIAAIALGIVLMVAASKPKSAAAELETRS